MARVSRSALPFRQGQCEHMNFCRAPRLATPGGRGCRARQVQALSVLMRSMLAIPWLARQGGGSGQGRGGGDTFLVGIFPSLPTSCGPALAVPGPLVPGGGGPCWPDEPTGNRVAVCPSRGTPAWCMIRDAVRSGTRVVAAMNAGPAAVAAITTASAVDSAAGHCLRWLRAGAQASPELGVEPESVKLNETSGCSCGLW